MKIRALSSFFHPQEGARAEGRDTKRCWILMDSHRRATQTRLLRLAHAVKCRRQRSPCRRQQLRLEALPPCALLHRVQALGSENLNRLKLVLVSAGWQNWMLRSSEESLGRGRRAKLPLPAMRARSRRAVLPFEWIRLPWSPWTWRVPGAGEKKPF